MTSSKLPDPEQTKDSPNPPTREELRPLMAALHIDQPDPITGQECVNSQHYGCDPDGTALKCSIYRGDRFVENVNLCRRCRAVVKGEGFDVLTAE